MTVIQVKGLDEQYRSTAFYDAAQFGSYFHQFHEVASLKPESVLEIGIGSGFLTWFLRHCHIRTSTFDIDPSLKPDIIGDVRKISSGIPPIPLMWWPASRCWSTCPLRI